MIKIKESAIRIIMMMMMTMMIIIIINKLKIISESGKL